MRARVALIPMRVRPLNVEENFRRFFNRVKEATGEGASLLVFPETTFTGYVWEEAHLRRLAETVPGPLSRRVASLAEAYGVFVVVGLLEKDGERFTIRPSCSLPPVGSYCTIVRLRRNRPFPPATPCR